MADGPKKPPKGNYEVGYGRPPKSGQFKPGQSGNPKGGKKREHTVSGALRAELAATQKVRENGKEKTLTNAEILAKKWVRHAFDGKLNALLQIAKNEPKALGQAVAAEAASADSQLAKGGQPTETHVEMMRWFLQGLDGDNARVPADLDPNTESSDE